MPCYLVAEAKTLFVYNAFKTVQRALYFRFHVVIPHLLCWTHCTGCQLTNVSSLKLSFISIRLWMVYRRFTCPTALQFMSHQGQVCAPTLTRLALLFQKLKDKLAMDLSESVAQPSGTSCHNQFACHLVLMLSNAASKLIYSCDSSCWCCILYSV